MTQFYSIPATPLSFEGTLKIADRREASTADADPKPERTEMGASLVEPS